ncbi:TerB family tellurite resistance protein [Lutibacter sp. B1]|uniref:TerB family tellurite resistance protein n=1 Tax=Lutibacter sp. B1 TaxID=2725996 RepID=UPI0014576E68|nr:TerB family tellurite resistance protein [Lutibacter sp. B1]NLP57797.1 DnaJ domain-containing protein [Lutibacter sp. B1]
MGNFAKWLGAGLGFTLGGTIGSIIGFTLGSFIDGLTVEDIQQERDYRAAAANTQAGDFEISLLILASIVIKSDGKVDERELNYVRTHFKRMYGEQRANQAFKLFKGFIKNNKVSTYQVCVQIRQNMTHASRLQLIHFLFGIAKADGYVNEYEVNSIKTIAGYLYINQYDFESIKAMFYDSTDSAYQILEIEKSATDDEVKKAYRKMVKKYHPDKLQHLGEEHLKGAEEKFREVQKAYEHIQKERGI